MLAAQLINILSRLDKKKQIQEEGGRHLDLNHATVWIHTTRSFMVIHHTLLPKRKKKKNHSLFAFVHEQRQIN